VPACAARARRDRQEAACRRADGAPALVRVGRGAAGRSPPPPPPTPRRRLSLSPPPARRTPKAHLVHLFRIVVSVSEPFFFTISGVSIAEVRHFRSRVCSQALFHCLHDISDAPSCSIRQGHEQSSPGSVIRYTYMPTVSERLTRSPAFPDAAKPSRWIGLRDIGLRGTDMRDRAEISLRQCSKLRALAGLGPVTSSDVRKIVR
jgi:hypothetical protein